MKPSAKTSKSPEALSPLRSLESHVVAGHGKRGTVPGAVEGNESAAFVFGGELRAFVKHEVHRRPVRGESGNREIVLAAASGSLAVAAILGLQEQFFLSVIVEAVGPAEVGSLRGAIEGLGGTLGIFFGGEHIAPERVELIAAVHGDVNRAVMPGDGRHLAHSGGEIERRQTASGPACFRRTSRCRPRFRAASRGLRP